MECVRRVLEFAARHSQTVVELQQRLRAQELELDALLARSREHDARAARELDELRVAHQRLSELVAEQTAFISNMGAASAEADESPPPPLLEAPSVRKRVAHAVTVEES